ncbi:MAG: SAM-dependent methyltransferase [Tenericutes bacterium]|nr:class I SAM-dependent methyltransferase [Bacilli bacterium]MDD3995968.1 class I SAM-dependent methyltransferase [Bacilli bacterium]MDD4624352.1 class I SAM-dependent methyltransferase [Bacilli bacterium]MDD4831896.1 class I SAM-dependent methyltransferase [Bacilli bacterium]NLV90640.1 SAM-dependent methyltransferase [Mycoplasmatota bacterium]
MISLSNRLNEITKYISKQDKVIDVGCDHALLGIYLIKNKLVSNIICSDIVEKAIERAKENSNKYKVNIDLRLGDGLKVLNNTDDINTIIISGMGYFKMRKILEDYKHNLNNINKIIIQTNTKEYDIRKYITRIGYLINKESIIKDNNIYYTNIMFTKGKENYSNKELRLGPKLLLSKNKLFLDYLNNLINNNEMLLKIIPKKYLILRLKKKIDIYLLKREIKL